MPEYEIVIRRNVIMREFLTEEAVVTVSAESEQEARDAVQHAIDTDPDGHFNFHATDREAMEDERIDFERIELFKPVNTDAVDYTAAQLRGEDDA
jgi:hypothetical protein